MTTKTILQKQISVLLASALTALPNASSASWIEGLAGKTKGESRIGVDANVDTPIASGFDVFVRERASADVQGKRPSFFTHLEPGFAIGPSRLIAIMQMTPQGNTFRAGVDLFLSNETLAWYLNVSGARKPEDVEILTRLTYTPQVAGVHTFARLEAISDVSSRAEHEFSTQRIRLGIKLDSFATGIALDSVELGKDMQLQPPLLGAFGLSTW